MTGALVLVSKGELNVEQIQTLLDNPDDDNEQIPRSTAPGIGLTMITTIYKEGLLFKEPQDIPEEYFMRGYKRRLEKMGIIYEVPEELTPEAGKPVNRGIGIDPSGSEGAKTRGTAVRSTRTA